MEKPNSKEITLPQTPAAAAGQRVDQFLAEALADIGEAGLSRGRVQELILEGAVFNVDEIGRKTAVKKKTQKVRAGDVFAVLVPPPAPMDIEPENIPIEILYEDNHLVVVNKPPHMATHPAAGSRSGTLVHALLHHCKGSLSGIGGVERPGIVHRLDKGTSGVMVVAKDDATHQGLAKQFKDRTIDRRYMALCYGVPTKNAGEVEGNIGRNPRNRKKMTVLENSGKPARTAYQVTGISDWHYAKLALKLHTGRTHQIRVHMTHIGHPLLGDPVYGKKRAPEKEMPPEAKQALAALNHQLLHAYKLKFSHPVSGKCLTFTTDTPDEMKKIENLLSIKSDV